MADTSPSRPSPPDAVFKWLVAVYVCILSMVVLGGVTRLTQSGLSIVQWKPIVGVIPPHTDAQWAAEFEAYRRATGQAAMLFPGLTVEQFKTLFFWEFTHRLVGRLTGVVFFVPFVVFAARRLVDRRLAMKLAAAFTFGGLQGLVGWVMVASGLRPDAAHVNHIKLAMHLTLAFALMSGLVWILCDLKAPRNLTAPPRWLRVGARAFLAVLALQIVYGAFTAGLRAGVFHNTFPTMSGHWISPDTFASPLLADITNNPATVQFIHRTLGWLLGLGAAWLWGTGQALRLRGRARMALDAVGALTLLQFALGVATLLLVVPVWLGAWHQLNAALLLSATVVLLHATQTRRA